MKQLPHISALGQVLFGLLLVGWPVLDTATTGAVTPLRIGLGSGMLLLLVLAILTTGRRGQLPKWRPTDWAVVACAVWYVGNVIFIGKGQTDPYYLLTGFIFLTAYIFCRIAGTTFVLPAMFFSGLVQAGIATAQLGGLLATRHAYYPLTGTFPNPGPLGGWLCIALLAAVLLAGHFYKDRRYIGVALCAGGSLYIGTVLLLTDSRAAWLGVAAGIFVGLTILPSFRGKRFLLWGLVAIGLIGTGLLYGYKRASADGRLLIWRVSADLIAQKPFSGHGVGSFPERYMFAQADYFERYPDSHFAAVADQVSAPFNELIGTACEMGIIGVLFGVGLFATAFLRRGDARMKVLLSGLVLFGFFSYPSAFLSFGLLGAALLADENEECFVSGRLGMTGLLVNGVVIGIGITLLVRIAVAGQTERSRYVVLQEASELMRRHDPTDLPRLEDLARQLPIAGFYVDLGDLCLTADAPTKAKAYYTQAARMIPSRLRPYDGLFRIYQTTGQIDSATIMAQQLLTMPVKVSNTTTLRLRRQAQEWLWERE